MRNRWLYAVVGSVILILLGLAAWTVFHLLVRTAGGLGNPPLPSDREIALMDESERARLASRALADASRQPDKIVADPAPGEGKEPFVFAQGRLEPTGDGGKTAAGRAVLYQMPDGTLLLRLEEFRVTPGPRLHVLLSVHPRPQSYSDLAAGILDLGLLRGNAGSLNLPLPPGAAVSSYKSAVILSKPFHLIFATAPLG